MRRDPFTAVIAPRVRDLGDWFELRAGRIELAGLVFDASCSRSGREPAVVEAPAASRALQFGGEPMDGPRHLSWNFVSSSAERIEQVKGDCRARRFAEAPGETEFIPLPE